jgi:hypothetical protein
MTAERRPEILGVKAALFRPSRVQGTALEITVVGQGFARRGAELLATVGREPVRSILPSLDGTCFTGLLERAPHPGDALHVWFQGGTPHKMRVTYQQERLLA